MAAGKKKSSRGFHQKLLNFSTLILLFGGLVAVGLPSAYMGMRFAVRGTEVEVPSIVGKSEKEAVEILQTLALGVDVVGKRFDLEHADGTVLSQHPRPGGSIKANRKVQVIVSLGKKRNPVPDLKGSTVRVARLVAAQSGFELGNIGHISLNGVDREEVVQQFPPPNSEGILSPRIDVLVGREYAVGFVMPKVTGQSLNRVLLLFERNGFEIGKIQYGHHPDVLKGTVVKQFPEPGYKLTTQDSINLEVAR